MRSLALRLGELNHGRPILCAAFCGHRSRGRHDEVAEHVDVEWFAKDGVDHRTVEPADRRRVTGCDHDDCRTDLYAAEMLNDSETIDAGHHQIQHEDAVLSRGEFFDRFGTVTGIVDGQTRAFNDLRDERTNRGLIINDKDPLLHLRAL